MTEPKYLGSMREVISTIAGDVVQVNEDLEVISLARAVLHRGADLIPRIYAIPDANVKITCKASISEGKVKLFGFGGSDKQEDMVEITLDLPLHVIPPSVEQLDAISKMTEEEINRRLAERGLRGKSTGSVFVPDVEND